MHWKMIPFAAHQSNAGADRNLSADNAVAAIKVRRVHVHGATLANRAARGVAQQLTEDL